MNTQHPEESGSEVGGKASPNMGGPGGSMRQRLPRSRRITSSTEIRALFQKGKRSRTAHLDVFDFASPFLYPRTGLVVPKHRRSAVERNKLKRQIREVLRKDVLPRLRERAAPLDVLVRARREAYGATFSQLREELVLWVERRCSRAF